MVKRRLKDMKVVTTEEAEALVKASNGDPWARFLLRVAQESSQGLARHMMIPKEVSERFMNALPPLTTLQLKMMLGAELGRERELRLYRWAKYLVPVVFDDEWPEDGMFAEILEAIIEEPEVLDFASLEQAFPALADPSNSMKLYEFIEDNAQLKSLMPTPGKFLGALEKIIEKDQGPETMDKSEVRGGMESRASTDSRLG